MTCKIAENGVKALDLDKIEKYDLVLNMSSFVTEKKISDEDFSYLLCPADEKGIILDKEGVFFTHSGFENLPKQTEVLIFERTEEDDITYQIREYPMEHEVNMNTGEVIEPNMALNMEIKNTTLEKFREYLQTLDLSVL